MTTLSKVGLVATPASLEDFQEYLATFNGTESTVAQVCAWMGWNLAISLMQDET